jgi:hypothetical protein
MASLHKNGFGFQIPRHLSYSEPLFMLLRTPGLYIFGVFINLPTFSQDMASNRAPDPPILAKILRKQAEITKKS